MRGSPFALGALLLLGNPHAMRVAASDIPLFEPADHFYKARGVGVKASWAVDRAAIPADGELTLTLTVRNARNPEQVVRPDLRKLPEFSKRFQIANAPGPPPRPARRRPRSRTACGRGRPT